MYYTLPALTCVWSGSLLGISKYEWNIGPLGRSRGSISRWIFHNLYKYLILITGFLSPKSPSSVLVGILVHWADGPFCLVSGKGLGQVSSPEINRNFPFKSTVPTLISNPKLSCKGSAFLEKVNCGALAVVMLPWNFSGNEGDCHCSIWNLRAYCNHS